MPTFAEALVTMATLRPLLDGATRSIYENGRRMEFDLDLAQRRYDAAAAIVAAANGEKPQARRVLFVQYGKGL